MIRVIIIDDHQLVIDGIRSLLSEEAEITCTGWALSGTVGLRKMQSDQYDVVLLDISMPEMDGLQACQLIRNKHPKVKIIALTMLEERSMIKAMVEAGANGYLLKNVGQDELVTAIKRVNNGKSHYSKEIAEILLSPEPGERSNSGNRPKLSSREKQILQLIVDEMTSTEISDTLNISVNTVETHRRNIMHKLGAKNIVGVVRIAIEDGLLD